MNLHSKRSKKNSRSQIKAARRYRSYEAATPVLKASRAQEHRTRARLNLASVSARWTSRGLLALSLCLVFWFSQSSAFYIDRVRVVGNQRLSDNEVLELCKLDGLNVFWADTDKAVRRVKALPDVASVQVRCHLPATCEIRIVERPPMLVWQQGDAYIWVGVDGVAVPARGKLPDAIVLQAVDSAALKPGERLDADIVAAIRTLQKLQPGVQTYEYSERYGLLFALTAGPYIGTQVRLGAGDQIALKLEIVRASSEHFLQQGIQPTLIDVRYPDAPYYVTMPDEPN